MNTGGLSRSIASIYSRERLLSSPAQICFRYLMLLPDVKSLSVSPVSDGWGPTYGVFPLWMPNVSHRKSFSVPDRHHQISISFSPLDAAVIFRQRDPETFRSLLPGLDPEDVFRMFWPSWLDEKLTKESQEEPPLEISRRARSSLGRRHHSLDPRTNCREAVVNQETRKTLRPVLRATICRIGQFVGQFSNHRCFCVLDVRMRSDLPMLGLDRVIVDHRCFRCVRMVLSLVF